MSETQFKPVSPSSRRPLEPLQTDAGEAAARTQFGLTLTKVRVDNRQSQTVVAKVCGVSRGTYERWEDGLEFPSKQEFKRLRGILPTIKMAEHLLRAEVARPEQRWGKAFGEFLASAGVEHADVARGLDVEVRVVRGWIGGRSAPSLARYRELLARLPGLQELEPPEFLKGPLADVGVSWKSHVTVGEHQALLAALGADEPKVTPIRTEVVPDIEARMTEVEAKWRASVPELSDVDEEATRAAVAYAREVSELKRRRREAEEALKVAIEAQERQEIAERDVREAEERVKMARERLEGIER
jgi:DNA-binding transcriptional regulator YiaG